MRGRTETTGRWEVSLREFRYLVMVILTAGAASACTAARQVCRMLEGGPEGDEGGDGEVRVLAVHAVHGEERGDGESESLWQGRKADGAGWEAILWGLFV